MADDMNVPTQPAQSSDIVTRLRNSCAHNTGDPDRCTRCGRENAYAVGGDAIILIEAQQAEIEQLRVLLDAIDALYWRDL